MHILVVEDEVALCDTIVRMGADIKVKCMGCGAIIMFSRRDFEKRLKKVIEHKESE